MIAENNKTCSHMIACTLALVFALWINGAIPFLMMPTLGQAVWSMGFAQSFADGSLATIHAHDFGLPQSSAIAFGLSGAWPSSLLLRLGMSAADAFSTMFAFWLVVAFFSARRLALIAGASRALGVMGALLWTSMPVIWVHAGFSMLSLGIALLPYYFLTLFRLIEHPGRPPILRVLGYLLAVLISVFMDGYSFMMFALGASILLAFAFSIHTKRRRTILWAVPIHLFSFAVAYLLYTRYVGTTEFPKVSLDFFRGWGMDLSFAAIPSQGVLWIPDLFALSVERSTKLFYGDDSAWQSTFVLPLVLVFGVVWFSAKQRPVHAKAALLMAILAFYLALGPSLKVQSAKPPEAATNLALQQNPLMPEDRAVMPTGSGWISEHLPGFNAMRAAYRWSALGVFSLWVTLMILLPGLPGQRRWLVVLAGLVVVNLPHPWQRTLQGMGNRVMYEQIDEQLVASLKQTLKPREVVAFIPWGNDFLANYLAPRAGIRTLNVGGDKGLAQAQSGWPPTMLALGPSLSAESVDQALSLLVEGHVDALALPYFNMLWAAHIWPCPEQASTYLTPKQREVLSSFEVFVCPEQRRQQLAEVVARFRERPYLEVTEQRLFASVRLANEYRGEAGRQRLRGQLFHQLQLPITFLRSSMASEFVLAKGWYSIEPGYVWSHAESELALPIPERCSSSACEVRLMLNTFAASKQRPVSVSLSSTCGSESSKHVVEFLSDEVREIAIPACSAGPSQRISLSIPQATSPQALGGSADSRVLGIALRQIDIH